MNKDELKNQDVKSEDRKQGPVLRKSDLQARNPNVLQIVLAGVIAALYVVLCLPFSVFSFGIVQFRIAEALAVLPVFTPAAVPGLFIGCLLSNILNPQNLGLIDIVGGSLTTLLAAYLTFYFAKTYRGIMREERQNKGRGTEEKLWKKRFMRFLVLLPPVVLNAVIVGTYLPYLLAAPGETVSAVVIIGAIASIFLSQTIIVYTLGILILLTLEKLRFPVHED